MRKNGSFGSRVVDWMHDRSILLGKTNEARDFFRKGEVLSFITALHSDEWPIQFSNFEIRP